MNIYEFVLSATSVNVSFTEGYLHVPDIYISPHNYSQTLHPITPEYHVAAELSIYRNMSQGLSTLSFHASAIVYFPEAPTAVSLSVLNCITIMIYLQ